MANVELSEEQEKAIRRMMEAVVRRDESAVGEMLAHRAYPESVYATRASQFWMWADDYADKRLDLVMPPGDVKQWGVWGFRTPGGAEGELSLHVDVWAAFGQTDLTIQFRLIPDEHGYRAELDDMHVMRRASRDQGTSTSRCARVLTSEVSGDGRALFALSGRRRIRSGEDGAHG